MNGFAAGGRVHDVQVLTAVNGAEWDSRLVTTLEKAPGRLAVVRRCVDIADLLATAAAGIGQAVLLSPDLRRLDREAVSKLQRAGVAAIGVLPAGEHGPDDRLARFGVRYFVPVDAEPKTLADVVVDAVADIGADARAEPDADRNSGSAHPAPPLGTVRSGDADPDALTFVESGGQSGRVIAVWGPCGSPGRTTLAVNIAMESALLDQPTILADADTYGASVAQTMGVLDESPGLAGAARIANNGTLDPISLARYAHRIAPTLHVLTGIAQAGRWTEVRPSALEAVWQQTRSVAAATVVDCGFCLEEDEALSFDTAAPQRNGATLATVAESDVVVAVGGADPVSIGRLVRGLGELREVIPQTPVTVVINRVRRAVVGADPEKKIDEALQRYAGVGVDAFVPDDPSALDTALAQGLTLAEAAPKSSARQAVRALTRRLLGIDAPASSRSPLARIR